MKKIYLFAMLLIMGFAANAQRNIQLQVIVDTPTSAFNIVTGTTIVPVYRIANLGPDTLKLSDTLAFRHPGLDTNMIINVWPTANIPMGNAVKLSGANLSILQTTFANIKNLYTASGTLALNFPPFANNTKYAWYGRVSSIKPQAGGGTITFNVVGSLDTAHVWINKSTGVMEFESAHAAIATYPNPAVNNLSFEYTFTNNENATTHIMDAAGRTVLVKQFENNSGTQKFDIDVTALQSGNYFLNLLVGDKTMTSKFTVQK